MQQSGNRKQTTNAVAHRKKQGGGRPGRQQLNSNKPRAFGDYCFDYLKTCKHNLSILPAGMVASEGQSQSSASNFPGHQGSKQSPSLVASTFAAPCPLCILTNQMTKTFFIKEIEQQQQGRLQSFRNRSILRTSLLHQWACSQSSLYYNLTNAVNLSVDQYNVNDFTFDIIWSTSLINCFLEYNMDTSIDFDDMIKVLQRRNRIYEVGYFAIIMIQRQVRRFLTLKRVRKYLLTRFEFIPPTKLKKATYYDSERLRRCDRYPKLLLSMPHYHSSTRVNKGFAITEIMEGRSLMGTVTYGENPGTPRTIKRRLQFEEKLAQERLENYKKSLEKLRETGINIGKVNAIMASGEADDVSVLTLNSRKELYLNCYEDISDAMVKQEQRTIRHLKQFVILHDLVYVTMHRIFLTMQYQQQVTIMMKKRLESLNVGNSGSRDRPTRSSDSEKTIDNSTTMSSDKQISVWLTPSAPCMSPRALGLTITLLTVPAPSSMNDPTTQKSNSSSMSTVKRPISASGNSFQLFRAMQLLEQYSFDALKCSSPEEVLKKLFLKDLVPVYESIVNITQDESGIWNSTYSNISHPLLDSTSNFRSKPKSISGNGSVASSGTIGFGNLKKSNNLYDDPDDASIGSAASQDTLMADTSIDDHPKEPWHEVLPFGIQLRPCISDHTPAGLFRLFYLQEEVVAISSYSPWVCYPEVMKNRDVILGNIRKFVNSVNMRTFVQGYYRNVNQRSLNTLQQTTSSGSRKMSTAASSKVATVKSSKSNNVQTIPSSLPAPSTLFTPCESMIFPVDDEALLSKPKELTDLNDQAVIALAEKHKFLKTLAMFQDRFKKAQMNVGRRKLKKDNILGTRPISTSISQPTDYDKERLLFEQVSPFLKGKRVYDLVQEIHPPVSNAKQPPKEKFVEHMDDYTLALWKYSSGVDLDIESRIIRPPDIAESHPPSIAQLLVVDLHVTLPKPKQPPVGRKMSSASGDDTSNNNSNVVVELHQVVGLFPCSQDKCPANLDCGLFEFDHFLVLNKPKLPTNQFGNNSSSDNESMKAGERGTTNSNTTSGNQLSNVVTWTNPDPLSGVCLGRSLLPSGKEFQVRIIGSNPSREYFEQNLPKKVKLWLGIETSTVH